MVNETYGLQCRMDKWDGCGNSPLQGFTATAGSQLQSGRIISSRTIGDGSNGNGTRSFRLEVQERRSVNSQR